MKPVTNYNLDNKGSATKLYTRFEPKTIIEKSEMLEALEKWRQGLLSIHHAFANNENYTAVAKKMLEDNYAFGKSEVLFKPTLASTVPFRITFDSALSYFIGGNEKYPEDRGFALLPWVSVEFEIAGVITGENQGILMGNKILKHLNGNTTIANFTMGFNKNKEGELKINLHHSSLPYTPA